MNASDPTLDWLNDQSEAMVELVVRLANQNSGTMNLPGLALVKQQLVDEFRILGGDLQLVDCQPRQDVDERGEAREAPLGQAIHIIQRPEAKHRVLLCIHMDTVYEVDHPFQTCRWLEDGRLNGPGVADAKGGLVVMLYALRALESSSLADAIGWEVLINPDEEIGSPGSWPLIEKIAPRCDFGLLFEPGLDETDLVSWRKGSGNFTFVLRGRSAHAGREFERGRNAVVAASRLAVALSELNTDPEVTYNVGKISGGGALNMVPELALVRLNVRVRTPQQQQQVEQQLDQLIANANQADGIEVTLHGYFSSPPKPITPGIEAVQRRIERAGAELGMTLNWRGTGGASDGNKFAAAGLPNIDSLGPCGGRIHSDEEFLNPNSLVPRAKLSALILLHYAREISAGQPPTAT